MSLSDKSSPRAGSGWPAGLDVAWAREQFPSLGLRVAGQPVVYLDNPAGTQVPRHVEQGMIEYFRGANANTHGTFLTSQRTDAVVERARVLAAALIGADSGAEIAFGPNMTTLTHGVSRAIGKLLRPGDELIVSDLDHDANISPWLDLEERGIVVRRIPIHVETGTLDLDAFERLLSKRTRLVAVGHASNALGTVNDVRRISERAHAAGAWVWLDAVHLAPHRSIDVRALDVDFLVCSAYKFFGPHLGIFWGKPHLLEALPAQRIRPAPSHVPDKFESGTKNHEGLAGLIGALEYLVALGSGPEHSTKLPPVVTSPAEARPHLIAAMSAIQAYEALLSKQLLAGLSSIGGVELFGLTSPDEIEHRVPTVAFRLRGRTNLEVAQRLSERGIFVWAGHHYALTLMERLGLGEEGVVRVGAVHYNTPGEIERLLGALEDLASRASGVR
jgi:cysteine desulfurase family protein (TIGR01976 family)